MRKKKIITALLSVSIISGMISVNAFAGTDKEIQIDNEQFKQHLIENCDLNDDGVFTESDADQIKSIYVFDNMNLKSFKELEIFKNLFSIDMSYCTTINEISNLDNFKSLKYLSLNENIKYSIDSAKEVISNKNVNIIGLNIENYSSEEVFEIICQNLNVNKGSRLNNIENFIGYFDENGYLSDGRKISIESDNEDIVSIEKKKSYSEYSYEITSKSIGTTNITITMQDESSGAVYKKSFNLTVQGIDTNQPLGEFTSLDSKIYFSGDDTFAYIKSKNQVWKINSENDTCELKFTDAKNFKSDYIYDKEISSEKQFIQLVEDSNGAIWKWDSENNNFVKTNAPTIKKDYNQFFILDDQGKLFDYNNNLIGEDIKEFKVVFFPILQNEKRFTLYVLKNDNTLYSKEFDLNDYEEQFEFIDEDVKQIINRSELVETDSSEFDTFEFSYLKYNGQYISRRLGNIEIIVGEDVNKVLDSGFVKNDNTLWLNDEKISDGSGSINVKEFTMFNDYFILDEDNVLWKIKEFTEAGISLEKIDENVVRFEYDGYVKDDGRAYYLIETGEPKEYYSINDINVLDNVRNVYYGNDDTFKLKPYIVRYDGSVWIMKDGIPVKLIDPDNINSSEEKPELPTENENNTDEVPPSEENNENEIPDNSENEEETPDEGTNVPEDGTLTPDEGTSTPDSNKTDKPAETSDKSLGAVFTGIISASGLWYSMKKKK